MLASTRSNNVEIQVVLMVVKRMHTTTSKVSQTRGIYRLHAKL